MVAAKSVRAPAGVRFPAPQSPLKEPTVSPQDKTALLEFDQIYNMDSVQGMRLLPPESVNLIVTDPPFAIDFRAQRGNYNRTGSRVIEGYNEIESKDYLDFTRSWMREASRVLADSGGMFVFSGWNNLKDILIAADELGLITVNHLIWKYQFGVVCKRRFVTSHYHCLYFCKNDKARVFFNSSRFAQYETAEEGGSLRYRDLEDVWVIKREYWHGDKKTPTKLPRELIEKILDYTSLEGHIVLDPFLGSGQVAVVAKLRKRRFVGFEIVKDYYDFAKERLDKGLYRLRDDKDEATPDVLGDK
jgi:site-specific DNA-methyltransferase (adenine-specific)